MEFLAAGTIFFLVAALLTCEQQSIQSFIVRLLILIVTRFILQLSITNFISYDFMMPVPSCRGANLNVRDVSHSLK